MPKEFFALNESSSSFLRANFFMVTLSSNNFNLSGGISSKSAGELKRVKISREVLPKTSEKTDSYSGKILSKTQMVCRLRSPIDETSENLNRERLRSSKNRCS